MGSSKSPKIPVTDYFLSAHLGICHAEIDSLNVVYIKERPVWCGYALHTMPLKVVLPDLFGGDKKEGGVAGTIWYLSGDDSQILPEELAVRYGDVPTNLPGYRGLGSIFFVGNTEETGFKWGSNNPYFPTIWANVTSMPKALGGPHWSILPSAAVEAGPAPVKTGGTYGLFYGLGYEKDLDNPGPAGNVLSNVVGDFTTLVTDPVTGQDYHRPVWKFYNGPTNMNFAWGGGGTVGQSDDTPQGGPKSRWNLDQGSFGIDIPLDPFHKDPDLRYPPVESVDAGLLRVKLAVKAFQLPGGSSPSTTLYVRVQGVPNDPLSPIPAPDPSYVAGMGDAGYTQTLDVVDGEVEFIAEGTISPGSRWVRINIFQAEWLAIFQLGVEITDMQLSFTWEEILPAHCSDMAVTANANPAHMIYECYTNDDWGRKLPPSGVNTDSFLAAAATLYDEQFGLSMQWREQAKISMFTQEVLDHIQGVVFTHSETGLLHLKLLRDDYDIALLPELDETNSKVQSFTRQTWDETINEIVVGWTNPVSEETETVMHDDPANIAIQGTTVSETREYYGIRDRQLAAKVAARDIRSAAVPLASGKVLASRAFWRTQPGDVLRLNSPDDEIGLMAIRVMKVERSRRGTLPVVLSFTEDVFGLGSAEFVSQPNTEWVDPTAAPVDSDIVEIQTAPAMLMEVEGQTPDSTLEPEAATLLFVSAPISAVTEYETKVAGTLPNGDPIGENRGDRATTPYGELSSAWVREAESLMDPLFVGATRGIFAGHSGDLLLLGSGESTSEIVMLKTFDEIQGKWVVARGMLDTVPHEWPVGTPAWLMTDSYSGYDGVLAPDGTATEYRFSTRTLAGALPYPAAAGHIHVTSKRPYAPNRPANVTVNGELFVETSVTNGDLVVVEWSNRNRLLEDEVLLLWTDGDASPEIGQTVEIDVEHLDGTVLQTESASGTAHSFAPVIPPDGSAYVRVKTYAVRDGVRSIQAAIHIVKLDYFGYGYNYGYDYGSP